MKQTPEYVTIPQLAERLSISPKHAWYMANSQPLRRIKNAVIDINKGGKRQHLRINIEAALKVFAVM